MVRWEGGPSEVSLPGPSMTTHHRGSVHVPRARVPRRATHHLLPPSRKRNLSSPHYLGTYVRIFVFFVFFGSLCCLNAGRTTNFRAITQW